MDEFLPGPGAVDMDPMLDWGESAGVVLCPLTPLSFASTEHDFTAPLGGDFVDPELSRTSFDSLVIDVPAVSVPEAAAVPEIQPDHAANSPTETTSPLRSFEDAPTSAVLLPNLVLLAATRNPSRFRGGEETGKPVLIEPEKNNWPIYGTRVHKDIFSSSGLLPLNTNLVPTRVVLVHVRGIRMRFETGVGRGRNPVNEQTGLSELYSNFFALFEYTDDCASNRALILLPDAHGNYGTRCEAIRLPVGRILVFGVTSVRTSSGIRYDSYDPFKAVIGPLVTNAREIDKHDYYRDLMERIDGAHRADMVIMQGSYRGVLEQAISAASRQHTGSSRVLELPAALRITEASITPDQLENARKLRAQLRTTGLDDLYNSSRPVRKHGNLGKRRLPLAPKPQ